jgi:Xaa-Pro aminopeptidase
MNRARALAYLGRCQLDGIVATTPVDVGYLTGWWCWLDPLARAWMFDPTAASARGMPVYAVFDGAGDVALVVPAGLAANALELDGVELHVYGAFGATGLDATDLGPRETQLARDLVEGAHPTALDALLAVLRARGLATGRLGVELDGLGAREASELTGALGGAELRDCSRLLALVRAVKTEPEIAALREATTIAESALREALDGAAPGVPLAALAARFRRHVVDADAEVDHFACGLRGLGIATEPSARRVRPGEVLYVDAGCARGHRIADVGLTLALGPLEPDLEAGYAALRDSVAMAAERLVPGARASDAWRTMRSVLDERGWGAAGAQGHGIGLEVREHPIVAAPATGAIRDGCVEEPGDMALEPGMVVNLEATHWLPGRASLHVERSFLVTATGAEPLAVQEREAPLQPRSTEALR